MEKKLTYYDFDYRSLGGESAIIHKYEVDYDENQIRAIRKRIINECSIIRPKETVVPEMQKPEGETIRNVVRHELVGSPISNRDLNLYRYTYEEYEFSPLVGLIDRLLNNDETVLPEICHAEIQEESSLGRELEEAKEACSFLPDSDPNKIFALREYQTLLMISCLNIQQLPPYALLGDLRSAINLKLVDSISADTLKQTLKFLGKTPGDFGLNHMSGYLLDPEVEKKQTLK